MYSLSSKWHLITSIVLFSVIITCSYLFVDDHLAFCTQDLREQFYVPLRILSILTSPATQLVIWPSLFLWYLLVKKSEKIGAYLYPLIASLILTNAIVRVIKVLFGRSRPDIFLSNGIYHLKLISFQSVFSSLPSGHAATTAAIMGFFAARYPRYSFLFIAVSVTLSLCRVFIGAHYLSDILVGNFIGLYVSWMFYFQTTKTAPAYLDYTQGKLSVWNKRILSKN
jgi:membrane-associated phospholipid phosphatase